MYCSWNARIRGVLWLFSYLWYRYTPTKSITKPKNRQSRLAPPQWKAIAWTNLIHWKTLRGSILGCRSTMVNDINRRIVLYLVWFIARFESVSRLECDALSCFCCLSCELAVFARFADVFDCFRAFRACFSCSEGTDWLETCFTVHLVTKCGRIDLFRG